MKVCVCCVVFFFLHFILIPKITSAAVRCLMQQPHGCHNGETAQMARKKKITNKLITNYLFIEYLFIYFIYLTPSVYSLGRAGAGCAPPPPRARCIVGRAPQPWRQAPPRRGALWAAPSPLPGLLGASAAPDVTPGGSGAPTGGGGAS